LPAIFFEFFYMGIPEMVKHLVMWRLQNTDSKIADGEKIKAWLEGLSGRIPGLLRIEVGLNFVDDAQAADVVLYSEFRDAAALAEYQQHPLHLEVVPKVKALTNERRSVDYHV